MAFDFEVRAPMITQRFSHDNIVNAEVNVLTIFSFLPPLIPVSHWSVFNTLVCKPQPQFGSLSRPFLSKHIQAYSRTPWEIYAPTSPPQYTNEPDDIIWKGSISQTGNNTLQDVQIQHAISRHNQVTTNSMSSGNLKPNQNTDSLGGSWFIRGVQPHTVIQSIPMLASSQKFLHLTSLGHDRVVKICAQNQTDLLWRRNVGFGAYLRCYQKHALQYFDNLNSTCVWFGLKPIHW